MRTERNGTKPAKWNGKYRTGWEPTGTGGKPTKEWDRHRAGRNRKQVGGGGRERLGKFPLPLGRRRNVVAGPRLLNTAGCLVSLC